MTQFFSSEEDEDEGNEHRSQSADDVLREHNAGYLGGKVGGEEPKVEPKDNPYDVKAEEIDPSLFQEIFGDPAPTQTPKQTPPVSFKRGTEFGTIDIYPEYKEELQGDLETVLAFPELPNDLRNKIEILVPEDNRIIVYEGRMYDLERSFTTIGFNGIKIQGRVSLTRTDYRKEQRLDKTDVTDFNPKTQEVEVPTDVWSFGNSEKNPGLKVLIYDGSKERDFLYEHELLFEALNKGVYLHQDLRTKVFDPIEQKLKEWIAKAGSELSKCRESERSNSILFRRAYDRP